MTRCESTKHCAAFCALAVERVFVFRGVKNRSFSRSVQGRIHSGPENKWRSTRWTKIGAAFPHIEGIGFSIELKAFPVDGRLAVLAPDNNDERSNNK